jgi:hypothetical protein
VTDDGVDLADHGGADQGARGDQPCGVETGEVLDA